MPYLDIKLGSDSLLVRFVGRVDYVVGRLPKADIQLRDMSVSRLHVQFFIDSRGQAFARDLGSSGGMLVNDTPVSNDMARLHDGSRIRIGQARVVFYDAQPPVNAVDPPGKSEPRGLIRLNYRKRQVLGGETVLAADKVSAQTSAGGPAEAPPAVNSAEFSEDGKAIEDASVRAPQKPGQPAKPAAPVAKPAPAAAAKPGAPAPVGPKKRDTGIMTAPWEDKRDFNRKPSGKQPTVPLPPKSAMPPKPGQPHSPAQAAKDAARQKNLPPAFESTAPEEDSRKTLYEPPLPPEQRQGRVAQRPGSLGGPKPPSAPIPKQPPPPAQPISQLGEAPAAAKPATAPEKRGDGGTRRRTLAEEMLEDYEPKAAMPTVKLGQGGPAKPPSTPRIPPPPPPVQESPAEENAAVEPDLTTDEIAEYFGGERATGKLKDVKFADTDPAQRKEEGAPEEVNFGPASARLSAAAGIEDEFDKPVEPTTSQIGAVTNLEESKVEEEPVRDTKPPEVLSLTAPPPARKPAEATPAKPGPTSEELDAEHQRKLEEVKRIAREAARSTSKIPDAAPASPTTTVEKPAIMPGMPTEQVDKPAIMPGAHVKPAEAPEARPAVKSAAYPVALPSREKRETKKLARGSEDPDTSKIKEFTIPITENPTQKVDGLVPGAKTLYIPKPEVVARKEERASKPELASMAQGPGGDTLAVASKEMMKEIEEEYQKSKSKGEMASLQLAEEVRKEPVPVDKVDPAKTPPDMPALPEQETVKKKPDSDEDMEFVVDDSYAFFTPPPPTRKDRKPVVDDLIDASEALPPEKKAGEPPANEKTVNE